MAFPSTAVIENFTGVDNTTPPNANWTNIAYTIKISSNTAAGGTSGQINFGAWDASTFGPNAEAFATVTTLGDYGVYVRLTTLVGATVDGYGLYIVRASTPDDWLISRVDNGVGTTIATGSQNIAANEKIGIEGIGSTIRVFHYTGGAWNQTPIQTTSDSTYANAGYSGLAIYGDFPRVDDFGAGTSMEIGTATGVLPGFNGVVDKKVRRIRAIEGGFTRSGSVERIFRRISPVLGNFTLAGDLARLFRRSYNVISELSNLIGSINRLLRFDRLLDGPLTFSGIVERLFSKSTNTEGELGFTGIVTNDFSKSFDIEGELGFSGVVTNDWTPTIIVPVEVTPTPVPKWIVDEVRVGDEKDLIDILGILSRFI